MLTRCVRTLLVLSLAVACENEQKREGALPGATTVARASLLLEPPTIGIGAVTTAVLLVSTPPDHRVLPLPAPEIQGVWVLESLVDPTEKSPTRWLHRTRVRLRPQETGTYVFPQSELTIESASGEQRVLHVASREFRVASILPSFPDRTAPFGLQEPGRGAASGGFWLPALFGAATALAAVAAVARWRRRREHRATALPGEPDDGPPATLRDWSQGEMQRAFETLDAEPREAANVAARFIRHYVESRFHTPTSASTTEELAAQKPPLAAHSYWPDFVLVLRSLDDLRWRPTTRSPAEDVHRARGALEAAQSFLESASPPGRGS